MGKEENRKKKQNMLLQINLKDSLHASLHPRKEIQAQIVESSSGL